MLGALLKLSLKSILFFFAAHGKDQEPIVNDHITRRYSGRFTQVSRSEERTVCLINAGNTTMGSPTFTWSR
jgi:hypothetical protein